MGKRDRPGSDKKTKKRAKKEEPKEAPEPAKELEGAFEKTNVLPEVKSTKLSKVKVKVKAKISETTQPIFWDKRIELAVSLLPGSLRNCEESVEDSIRQLLMKYSEGLNGILMAFDNVQLKRNGNGIGRGWVLNELPLIHYNATCDALVFSPTVGSELHGVVNECFPSHLSILVFNYFNAMVSADQLRASGYSFDPDLQNWASEGGARTISINDKIKFVVEKVHECEGTVSLEGVNPSRSLLVET